MNKYIIALLLVVSLVLCGCTGSSQAEEGDRISVYRLDQSHGGSVLAREKIKIGEGQLFREALVKALNSPSGNPELQSAFPDDVKIESIELENGIATVTMSPAYLSLEGRDKLRAEAALVLSLSTLDEICYIDIVCMNRRIASSLSLESYVEADGLCESYERSLKLYLPDPSFEYLKPRTIQSSDSSGVSLPEAVLLELFASIGGGMEDTQVISADISGGVCRVELSQEFYGKEPANIQKGKMVIYSAVNSLCRIPGVEAVTITVEGIDVEGYGDYTTVWPISADMSLVNYQEK